METRELCARNLAAAHREALNARTAAFAGGTADDDDLTRDLIARACELLDRASKRFLPKSIASVFAEPAAAPDPTPEPKPPTPPDPAKVPAQA